MRPDRCSASSTPRVSAGLRHCVHTSERSCVTVPKYCRGCVRPRTCQHVVQCCYLGTCGADGVLDLYRFSSITNALESPGELERAINPLGGPLEHNETTLHSHIQTFKVSFYAIVQECCEWRLVEVRNPSSSVLPAHGREHSRAACRQICPEHFQRKSQEWCTSCY